MPLVLTKRKIIKSMSKKKWITILFILFSPFVNSSALYLNIFPLDIVLKLEITFPFLSRRGAPPPGLPNVFPNIHWSLSFLCFNFSSYSSFFVFLFLIFILLPIFYHTLNLIFLYFPFDILLAISESFSVSCGIKLFFISL